MFGGVELYPYKLHPCVPKAVCHLQASDIISIHTYVASKLHFNNIVLTQKDYIHIIVNDKE